MSPSDYEYTGLMAEAWDLLRGDTSGWPDRFFYLELIGRYGQPHEIASVVALLASPEAGFMTGADIVADGGLTA